jgi:hypothetical protein
LNPPLSEFRVQGSGFRVQGSEFRLSTVELQIRNPEPGTPNPKPAAAAIPDGKPNSVPMRPRPQIIESTKVDRSAVNVSDAAAGRFRDRRFPLLKRINTQLQLGDWNLDIFPPNPTNAVGGHLTEVRCYQRI